MQKNTLLLQAGGESRIPAYMKRIKNREQFEIIVDTCSSGDKVLRGIDKLISRITADHHGRSVFQDYRITVPIQLGTESKQCLFPEFLEARLSKKSGHLENFYRKHREHFRIVETDTSRAFKMAYCFEASALLNTQEARESIITLAGKLADELHQAHGHQLQLDDAMLDRFIHAMRSEQQTFDARFSEKEQGIRSFHHALQGRSDAALDALIKTTYRVKLGRAGKRFFEQMPEEFRYFMQALYSDREVNKQVSKIQEFKNFRHDQGERAIEDFLFKKRSESNPDRVTLIISEDQGARFSISSLRKKTENTIFCVSTYGLAQALKQLHLVGSITDVIGEQQLADTYARHENRRSRRAPDAQLTMNHVVDPEIEEKWARRLANVVNWGHWKGAPSHSVSMGR